MDTDGIPYIQSEHSIDDTLKKIEEDLILLRTLRKSTIDHLVEQWINRGTLQLEQRYEKSNFKINLNVKLKKVYMRIEY